MGTMKRSTTIHGNMASLDTARDFVGRALAQEGMDKEDIFDIVLAVDEWISNIISHSYKVRCGKIEINLQLEGSIQLEDSKCTIIFKDQGETFSFYSVKEPDITEHIQKRIKRGFGIYLIKKLMDEVEYSSFKGYNQFKMMKNLKRGKNGKT